MIARIFEHLKELIGVGGYTSAGSTYEKSDLKAMMVWSVGSNEVSTKFSLVNWQNRVYAFISGESDDVDVGIRPWLTALNEALSRRDVHEMHAWQALIGLGRHIHGGSPSAAPKDFGVAGMSAVCVNFSFEEDVFDPASLISRRRIRWQPFLVSGSSAGHSWQAAETTAREDLHLLCAVLSIHSKRLWRLREQPYPTMWGSLRIPESLSGLTRAPRLVEEQVAQTDYCRDIQLQQLWVTCKEDPEVAAMVRAYYESVQLSDHPSFALIGFVGVIEAVGAKIFPDPPRELCESCRKPKSSAAAKRFRDALSLVMPPDRVKVVSERLYRWRSGTAHAGRLHAMETSFGLPKMSESMMVENKPTVFQVRGPQHAQEIARDLLIHILERRPVESH